MSEYRDSYREVEKEAFWTLPRFLLVMLGILVLGGILTFASTGIDLANYKFWAPKQENAKREVFQNTQSYVQGKTEYISRLRLEYQTAADPNRKAALRTLILSEASTVDTTKLPEDLQGFIQQLKDTL